MELVPGTYAQLKKSFKAGDVVELELPMPVQLIESNPLVEETRNQVAVKRGPVVYCLESIDLPKDRTIFDLAISIENNLKPARISIENSPVTVLRGDGVLVNNTNWARKLYRPITGKSDRKVPIQLVPYYAWGNRGHTDMSVWLPWFGSRW